MWNGHSPSRDSESGNVKETYHTLPVRTCLITDISPHQSHIGTSPQFLACTNQILKNTGLEPLQGHSIRIGSTLEYLLLGLSFEGLRIKGRWASDAFTLYLRVHAGIMAPHIHKDDSVDHREELVPPDVQKATTWIPLTRFMGTVRTAWVARLLCLLGVALSIHIWSIPYA